MPTAPPDPTPGESRLRLAPQDRVAELAYELTLARELRRRTEEERRHLDVRLAAAEAEQIHLRAVLAQREAYVAAIHGSIVWKAAQILRRILGREW